LGIELIKKNAHKCGNELVFARKRQILRYSCFENSHLSTWLRSLSDFAARQVRQAKVNSLPTGRQAWFLKLRIPIAIGMFLTSSY